MNLRCQICESPTLRTTADLKHIICSMSCYDKFLSPTPLSYRPTEPQKDCDVHTLSARGRGGVKVMPDRVRITLVVIRRAPTVSEVNRLLITNADKLIELLKKSVDAEKIQTADLNIQPQYANETPEEEEARRRRNEERKIESYEGRFPISFEAVIAQAGPLIDLVLKDDHADSVEGLRYIVSDAVSKPAHTEALRLAALDAQAQAQVVLETLGLRKKGIINISIQDTGYSIQSGRQYSDESVSSFTAKREMAASTQLMAPEDEIVAMVSLEVSYE